MFICLPPSPSSLLHLPFPCAILFSSINFFSHRKEYYYAD
nr:MAG TPA: hypothetical protein [Caudoviricetes sp.]